MKNDARRIRFSKAERGKFYRPNAEVRIPIYLDAEVERHLTERAADKGIPLGDLVNGLLRRNLHRSLGEDPPV